MCLSVITKTERLALILDCLSSGLKLHAVGKGAISRLKTRAETWGAGAVALRRGAGPSRYQRRGARPQPDSPAGLPTPGPARSRAEPLPESAAARARPAPADGGRGRGRAAAGRRGQALLFPRAQLGRRFRAAAPESGPQPVGAAGPRGGVAGALLR